MYIKRTIEAQIKHESEFYSVLVLTGPRQVGKTTVLKECGGKTRNYVSLDTLENRELAKRDPNLFLQRFPAPVLIDEIQYAPELLPYIKAIVDNENQKEGLFWLTGSQQFHLMKDVSESLAGRARILHLQGLSQGEKEKRPDITPFIPTSEYINLRANKALASDINKTFEMIWKGSFPKLYSASNERWAGFYDSYIKTYIERDIRTLALVSDELSFLKFMRVLAARNAQILNCSEISNEVGVSQPTIKSWVSILNTSGVIYLLDPYFTNLTKRAIKTPKVYFTDTGLACYLTGWRTPETLELGAMSGPMLESYVITEILKSYWNNGVNPNVWFYRDIDKNEVDLVIEENGVLHPIEIKKSSNPSKRDISGFEALRKLKGVKVGNGAVVCMATTHLPISDTVSAVPVAYL